MITIYFAGGVSTTLCDVDENTISAFIKWLDDKDDTGVFIIEIRESNKVKYIRKDLIAFVDVS